MIAIVGDWDPRFYFQNLYFCKVNSYFPIFRGSLYPFASEAPPMLYENAWYLRRLEPPFLLPESLFIEDKLFVGILHFFIQCLHF